MRTVINTRTVAGAAANITARAVVQEHSAGSGAVAKEVSESAEQVRGISQAGGLVLEVSLQFPADLLDNSEGDAALWRREVQQLLTEALAAYERTR